MLTDFVKSYQPDKETVKASLKAEREKLNAVQMKIKDARLPVMVIFEGWGSAGKGSIISSVIQNIDPRFFRVATTNAAPTEEEKRKPFLYRYFIQIPEAGKFQFFDTCWMEEVVNGVLNRSLDHATYEQRIKSINTTERQLHDNGYLVMKFFFNISRKEQKRRLDELLGDKNTKWRVTDSDLWENEHYDECQKDYYRYLDVTNRSTSP